MTSVTIGRSRDCDFVLDDFYISRSHCRLEIRVTPDPPGPDKYRFTLIDFGSVAGTIVNDQRVDRVDLENGDRIQIGSVRFRFRILDDEGAT
jgi:pSer/pThr/pTyr-binding forkhead associated (FHA) protein